MSHRHYICHGLLLIFVFVAISIQLTKCDVHTYGPEEFGSQMFFGHELFSRNTSDAKDYALYYKYRAQSMNGMVGYVVLNSTANSSGSISANHDMDFDKERIVEANASIRNASNFNVDMKILGFSSGVNLDGFGFLHRYRTPFKPRSFAVICGVVPNRRMQKQRTLEFGKRINGDFLVRFERNQVMTKGSKFPTHTFDFFDGGINITYVKLTIDSPTAIVFSNKVVLDKYKFFGRIYGTDFNTFTAEIHIYGVKI